MIQVATVSSAHSHLSALSATTNCNKQILGHFVHLIYPKHETYYHLIHLILDRILLLLILVYTYLPRCFQ